MAGSVHGFNTKATGWKARATLAARADAHEKSPPLSRLFFLCSLRAIARVYLVNMPNSQNTIRKTTMVPMIPPPSFHAANPANPVRTRPMTNLLLERAAARGDPSN